MFRIVKWPAGGGPKKISIFDRAMATPNRRVSIGRRARVRGVLKISSEWSKGYWGKLLKYLEQIIDNLMPTLHLDAAADKTRGEPETVPPERERYEESVAHRRPPAARLSALRIFVAAPLAALAAVSLSGLLHSAHTALNTPAKIAVVDSEIPATSVAEVLAAPTLKPAIMPESETVASAAPAVSPPPAENSYAPVQLASLTVEEIEEAPVAGPLLVRVGKGDTLFQLLTDAGVGRDDANATVAALKGVYDPRRLWPGQEISLNFETGADGDLRFLGMSLDRSYDREVVVARAEEGGFSAEEIRKQLTHEPILAKASITSSLFTAGENAGLPPTILIDLIRAYSFDVDFQREIQKGDSFEVLYERVLDDQGEIVNQGKIIYANLVLSGEEIQIFRFTPSSGFSDFFHANGQSVRKALLRTPIDGARISSGFGKRKHPILGYTKMHRGTDFAAPSGTPIYAAGDGVIEKAGWNGGYGRYIRLRHNDTYKTAYAHLSKIASGIAPGKRIRQGQVIGYVGSSGRSTGPHLHYEVMLNGNQVNPLSVKLPAGEKLKGSDLANFEIAKAEIERTYANLAGITRLAENTAD